MYIDNCVKTLILLLINQKACNLQLWYPLSKTLGEDAGVTFCKEKGLDLVVVNPGFVIGPILQPTLNTTSEWVMGLIATGNCLLQLKIDSSDLYN